MQIDSLIFLELVDDPSDQSFVNIVAAKVSVAVGRLDLDDAFADFEDRDVERTAAEVKYGDGFVLFLIQTVRQCGGGRLIHDTQHFKPGDLAGILGRLTLSVVEVRGNRDDRLIYFRAKIVLGRLLQLLKNHRRYLGRAILLALQRQSAHRRSKPFRP